MTLNVQMLKPVLVEGQKKAPNLHKIEEYDLTFPLFDFFKSFVKEETELVFSVEEAIKRDGLSNRELSWLYTTYTDEYEPVYYFIDMVSGVRIKLEKLPMIVTAEKFIYAQPIESIQVLPPSKFDKWGRAFFKLDEIKEVFNSVLKAHKYELEDKIISLFNEGSHFIYFS